MPKNYLRSFQSFKDTVQSTVDCFSPAAKMKRRAAVALKKKNGQKLIMPLAQLL